MGKKPEDPSRYTTWAEVEVDIPTSELLAAGWIYVGEDPRPTPATVMDVIERWHNDTHPGAFRFCDHSPCVELRAIE